MLSNGRLSIIWLIVLAVTLLAGAGRYFQGQLADQDASPSPAPQEIASKLAPPAGMDEAQREYISDIKHHGNVLSRGDDRFRALRRRRSDRDACSPERMEMLLLFPLLLQITAMNGGLFCAAGAFIVLRQGDVSGTMRRVFTEGGG